MATTGDSWLGLGCCGRAGVKAAYGFPENKCGDCCTYLWCYCCALT